MQTLLILALVCVGAYAQFGGGGRDGILNGHNNLRSKIAKGQYVARGTRKPSGSNMLKMKWDGSLESSAQNYANSCPSGHSTISDIGENLYYYWSRDIGNLDRFGGMASAAWESEFQDYGWSTNKFTMSLANTGVGHATQMAWALTDKIGCGVKNCGPDGSKGGLTRVVVVCHYKIQGNYIFKSIYNEGSTCSSCPSGTSCEQSSGLCA
ncbi:hypothetical protein GCK72_014488 [Caenorhabditis remanei]|uniref:SCP domain-containing protein n=1 Tax=Caenorhabditis remanei TaxID=31234 RepID=E3M6E4_CAERE|nr:hypothetical protein GCK72_014488 [Caenorhabditis remanei]EFO91076.1 hypothetical protein CRE_21683 [Caenorhabditis remanei]EFO93145.1 hypothetical protein CRE_10304 [Caenorhabditis remanei]KAF1758030.1 hypothetical protein GCK72_014488 [Caenorhabditis remanei]